MYQNLLTLYEIVDKAVEEIYQQHPNEIECHPGCADCCHAVFDISFIEASYLASVVITKRKLLIEQKKLIETAASEFELLMQQQSDPASSRIRCPLLANNKLCLVHEARPINCRTYGTPTVIDGKSHVCGFSKFTTEKNYPTIDLKPLQKKLQAYSTQLVGEQFGSRRFPISWVLLKPTFFLPQ